MKKIHYAVGTVIDSLTIEEIATIKKYIDIINSCDAEYDDDDECEYECDDDEEYVITPTNNIKCKRWGFRRRKEFDPYPDDYENCADTDCKVKDVTENKGRVCKGCGNKDRNTMTIMVGDDVTQDDIARISKMFRMRSKYDKN